MNLHIPLSKEAEAKLREQASAAGKDIETYVLEAVQQKLAATTSQLKSTPTPASTDQSAEEAFLQDLVSAGLLSSATLPRRDIEAFQQWQPISLTGKPLSETIIEERR